MQGNNIIIISRSDRDASVPKIIVRSRSDRRKSGVVEEVRTSLLQRKSSFEIKLTDAEARSYTPSNKDLPFYLINRACSFRKPFVNNDFDYLRRSVRQISCRIKYTATQVTITYNIVYLTTLSQEAEIDRVLQALFKEKSLYNIRETLPKIKFAYDYIIENVKYDDSFTMYSAYHALINKRAVCEGCATLLYRMLSMFGVPCRILTGRGLSESHAWNLIKLNGKWYNADVTWDLYKNPIERRLSLYSYFLKTNKTFHDHTRDLEFATSEFVAQHPMSETDYTPRRKFESFLGV